MRKPFAHHYSLLANYTYSKSIDICTDIQLTDTPMDYLNPRLDRGLSENDVRHRLVLTGMAETPSTWNPLLRSFKVSMLNTLQSPRYYSVFAGFDVNGDGYPFADRVGNIGRNTYRGDSLYTTDVRVQRIFNLGERLQAEASAEVFNLFNRQNVIGIDTVYVPPLSWARSRKSTGMASAVQRIRRSARRTSSPRRGKFSSPCG